MDYYIKDVSEHVLQYDRLGMCHFIKCAEYSFRADARMFVASKRHLEAPEEACSVDDRSAALQGVCNSRSPLHILCEYAAAKPEDRAVCYLNSLFFCVKRYDRNYRSEYLHIYRYVCILRNVTDDSRVIESSVALASQQDFSALLNAEEKEELDGIYNDIVTTYYENVLQFIMGVRPLSEFDAFTDQLHSMGIDRCIEIVQGALDRYYARIN